MWKKLISANKVCKHVHKAFFRITVLPYFSVEVNEVHVFLGNSILSMAMTPVNSIYKLHAAPFVVEAT